MTTKQRALTITGVIIVVVVLLLTSPRGQLAEQSISFETVSTSSQFFRLQAELPAQELIGAETVRSFITNSNTEFIAQANQEGPEIAEIRGDTVQFTQDVLVEATTTKRFISYKVEVGSYTGGANANSIVKTFVFDKRGHQLSNGDVIIEGQREAFMTALREALSTNPSTFPNVGEDVSFPELNLYITKDSIIIPFSEYEVGPGAAGIVTISLPRDSYLAE